MRGALVALVLFLAHGCGSSSSGTVTIHESEGGTVPRWRADVHLPPAAIPGAQLVAKAGCLACHSYDGEGSRNYSAPDLTAIGRSGKGAAWFAGYVADPRRFGNEIMPSFSRALSRPQLRQIGVFLVASKGKR